MKWILILALMAGSAVAADLDNGHFWNDCSHDGKLHFVVGYGAGASAAIIGGLVTPGKYSAAVVYAGMFPVKLTYGDIVDAMDRFYATPANRPISIAAALLIISCEADGTYNAKQVEEMILRFRQRTSPSVEKEQ